MSSFFEALEQGYTPDQVLGYLSKSIPQMGSLIKKAQRSGYPAQQILGFLSKNFDTEDRTGMSTSERYASNRRSDSERTKYGLQLAGAAIATPLAARAAQSALSRAIPSSLQALIPGGSGASPGPSNPTSLGATHPLGTESVPTQGVAPQGTQTQVSSSSQPPISPSIPNQASPIQPEEISNIPELIKKHGFERQIEEVSKNVKDPKGVAAILFNKFPKEMQALQKEAGKPMEDVVAEYMGSQPEAVNQPDVEPTPEAAPTPEIEMKALPGESTAKVQSRLKLNYAEAAELVKQRDSQEKTPEFEPLKIEKGSLAASPQGVGEVKEIRNGKAIIEVDGKKHQVNEDELIQSPIPEKDLGELFEEMQAEIEKQTGQEISRNVEYAAYSPENNELLYKPHSGGFYVYDNIEPEVADELVNLLTLRRSSGNNYIGPWVKGTKSPIGSRMYDLIKKLQAERGGKGNEYRGKYQTIYDALEPAREAKKRLHEERRKKAKKPRPN